MSTLRRELGPFAIGLGGAVAMAGAIAPWAEVRFNPQFLGVELAGVQRVTRVMGTDLAGGTIAISIGIAVAVAAIAAILSSRRGVVVTAAAAALAGGVAILGIAIHEWGHVVPTVLRGPFDPYAGDPSLGARRLHKLVGVTRAYGLSAVIAGAAVAVIGGVATLVAFRRSDARSGFG